MILMPNLTRLGQPFRSLRHRFNVCRDSILPLPSVAFNAEPAVPSVPRTCHSLTASGSDAYPRALIGASTIEPFIAGSATVRGALSILDRLQPDEYLQYTMAYYREGLRRWDNAWHYADIATVLYGVAGLMQPDSYLEIGVRRGRSMAMVASQAPRCSVVGFDLWMEGYAGMPNPGPSFVRHEMQRVGFSGSLELVSGNSHRTVRDYFRSHRDAFFDMITVDGDHSRIGAATDLADVLPHLKVGGVVVFDDIAHPKHPSLRDVWHCLVGSDSRFNSWKFDELGYGVAFGVRKW